MELSYAWAAPTRRFYAEPEDDDAWKTAQQKLRQLLNIRRPIETAQHRALFRLMKENKREVIFLEWARSFNLNKTHQIPSTIKINLDYIIDQIQDGQLAKNWQKYAVLRQAWESLCQFLDGTTCQKLREPSFLIHGAALTRMVLRLCKDCYQNGMGFLSLLWSSVTRFFALMKAAQSSNRDLDSDNLVDDTTGPLDPNRGNLVQEITTSLAEIQWYNFMPHMTAVPAGIKNLRLVVSREPLQPVPVSSIPLANPEDISPVDDAELKDIFLAMRKEEEEITWQRTKDAETLQDSDTFLIQSNYTSSDPDDNWKFEETLTEPLGPFTVSEVGPSKQAFIDQCLTALRTLKSFKTVAIGKDFKLTLHSRVLKPLCRGLYTLLKFQTPPEEFVGIANAIVPFDELQSHFRRAASTAMMSSLNEVSGSTAALLDANEILLMSDYIIDILTDAQFSASNWPAPQLSKNPSGTWFAENSPVQGPVEEIASSSTEDDDDEPDSESEDESEGGVEIEPDSDGDAEPGSVAPKDVAIVIKPVPRAPYPAKLQVVCKSWVDGFKRYMELSNDRVFEQDEDGLYKNYEDWMNKVCWSEKCGPDGSCKQLHPDLFELPGLCRDWVRNKCNDVDCLLAHADPLYPRNMHLAHLEPRFHPKPQSVCKFWQRDQCNRGNSCANFHFIPGGQSKVLCEFYQDAGCLNLDDRCTNKHVRGAPWPIPLYSSDYIDPEAPEDQPDRRPLSHYQRSEGANVRILCLNMVQNGTCWRKDNCWLEHNLEGVKISFTKDPKKKIPDSLTVTTGQPVVTDERDICPHYLKHGECYFWKSYAGCRYAIHTREDPSEKARSQTGSQQPRIIGNAAAQRQSNFKPLISANPVKSKATVKTAPFVGDSKIPVQQRSTGGIAEKKEAGAGATPASTLSGPKATPVADNSAPMMNSIPPQMLPYGPGFFGNTMGQVNMVFNQGQQFNVPYNQFGTPGFFAPNMAPNQMNFPGNFGQNMPPNQFGLPGNFGMNMPMNYLGQPGNFGSNMPAPSMGRRSTMIPNEIICHYCGSVGHKRPHCRKMELDKQAGKHLSNTRGQSSHAQAPNSRAPQQSASGSAYAQNLSGFQVSNNGHGQNSHQGPSNRQTRPGQIGNKRKADDDDVEDYAQPDRQNGKRKTADNRTHDDQAIKRNKLEGEFEGNRVAKRKAAADDDDEDRATDEVKRHKLGKYLQIPDSKFQPLTIFLDTGRENRAILPPRGPRTMTERPSQITRPAQPRQPPQPRQLPQDPNGELRIRGAAGNRGDQPSTNQRGRGHGGTQRRQGPPPGGRRPPWR